MQIRIGNWESGHALLNTEAIKHWTTTEFGIIVYNLTEASLES